MKSRKSKVAFVVNPTAGGGLASREEATISNWRAQLAADITYTDPVYGADKCAEPFARYDVIWVAGGDGTLSQVVNSLYRVLSKEHQARDEDNQRVWSAVIESFPQLQLLPIGTGNDFAYSLGISGELDAQFEGLSKRQFVDVDCGIVRWTTGNKPGFEQRTFVNGVGLGLGAEVAARARRLKKVFGRSAYVAAAVSSLLTKKPQRVTLEVDGKKVDVSCLLAEICNGSRAGGGFFLTPNASITDGLFDICLLQDAGLIRAARLLPAVKAGRHLHFRETLLDRGKCFRLESDKALPMHIDGEVVARDVLTVDVAVGGSTLRFGKMPD